MVSLLHPTKKPGANTLNNHSTRGRKAQEQREFNKEVIEAKKPIGNS